jgi:hypothetical protein
MASEFWRSVEWYHGSVSMVKTNEILEQVGEGSFLVRDGKVGPGPWPGVLGGCAG